MVNVLAKALGGRRRPALGMFALGLGYFRWLNCAPRSVRVATAAFLGAALAAGCSSSSGASSDAEGGSGGSGTVNVLYAGSMVGLMKDSIGPAFQKATGHKFSGFTAGDKDVASQIKAGVHAGDIFMSASPTVNGTLIGPANDNLISWYATYATSPLVIGYKPDSKFAADLKSKPWYTVITEPGFRLGFSDPKTDPKGEKSVQAMNHAASVHNLPALQKLTADTSSMFPEDTLVGRVQSGQLDAAYFYASEAAAAKIPTVPVTGENLGATYTVAVLNKGPHQAAAQAFVSYLLGPDGLRLLKEDGFVLITPPQVTGSGIPAGLKQVLAQ
jgi:molybdate/tungstate transport system substrate-binding protein